MEIELVGSTSLIRKLRKFRKLGADDGEIAKQLTIAVSRTSKEVRRRADRLLAAELGMVVKTVEDYFPHSRATDGGIVASSYVQIGFPLGIQFDNFKIRRIGGRRGLGGVSVNTGRKKHIFPKAFILNESVFGSGNRDLMFELKGKRDPKLKRPRTLSPIKYIEAGGGLAVLRDYAERRLRANIKDRIEWSIIKAEKARDGNG